MPSLFDVKPEIESSAIISPCGTYRYRLSRTWNDGLRPAVFIMLNPSTADASKDDPTIRRCVSFAKHWGCGGIVVVNLFALRATNPNALYAISDPVGPHNNLHILSATIGSQVLVAAWGVHGTYQGQSRAVVELLAGLPLKCLGATKDRHPRHPLYVRSGAELVPYPVA